MENTQIELFAIPFTCSYASHIVLHEAGLPHRLCWVDPQGLADGRPLTEVNPKGKVPTLRLPGGEVITENVAVLAYLSERSGAPQTRAELEWLSFLATELHKGVLFPIFRAGTEDAVAEFCWARLGELLPYLDGELQARGFLAGEAFGVADAYLYWALRLLRYTGRYSDAERPGLRRLRKAIEGRPAVAEVTRLEMAAMAALGPRAWRRG